MIRHCVHAGSWYPSDREELSAITKLEREEGKPVRFAVLPHAGLFFSRRGIAPYFARLDEEIRKIIILAPSHHFFLEPDRLLTSSFREAETPYGSVRMFPLEGCESGGEDAIEKEHAVEMVLPFIAERGNTSVAMALISQVSNPLAVAEILAPQIDGRTGLIASSDFTHYGRSFNHIPHGAVITEEVTEKVREEDRALALLLAENKAEEALAFSREHHSTVCGIAPAAIAAALARMKGLSGEVTDQYDSYHILKGGDSFVSYVTVLWG